MIAGALTILAVALAAGAIMCALGALTTRALFVACAYLAALGGLASSAAVLLGAGDGALALGVFGVALAPVLLLAATLSSTPAVRSRRSFPWLSVAAASLAAVAALTATVDLAPIAQGPARPHADGLGFWLAPLLLAAATACAGLIGYGERGVFARRGEEREP